MLKNIKLTTINKLLASALILSCIVLAASTLIIEKNISFIDDSWRQYQADRSDKARLESALRTAIGYGGMVHDFKNFVLRNDIALMSKIHREIGAAESTIKQYRLLQLSDAEITALDDIYNVIQIYEEFHLRAEKLIKLGASVSEIDTAVKIDESPVLRGLETLRHEVSKDRDADTQLSRARVSADLRGALGYGGVIHNFKNYVLRHNLIYKTNTIERLQEAYDAIEKHRNLNPTYAEKLALSDIESTLNQYRQNLDVVSQLISENKSIKEIDQAVVVNDKLALRGLSTLDKAIHDQIDSNNIVFTEALNLLKSTSKVITGGLLVFLLSVFIFGAWLIQARVISPLLKLTSHMNKLSQNDLSISLDDDKNNNELGDMARAMSIFKVNMIERQEAKKKLEAANDELNTQLNKILVLREQSEQQTSQALSLAEGLASARKTAEELAVKAEENELRVSSVLNSVQDAIITIDPQGTIENVNPATEQIFGYHSSELIGNNISILVSESHQDLHQKFIEEFAKGQAFSNNKATSSDSAMQSIEQKCRHKDGSNIIVELHVNTIKLSGENKIIGVVKDITERKKWEKELKILAMTDPLTGLANRNQYNKKLTEAAAVSLRSKNPFALMLLDLDEFKAINDRCGHPVGDLLLIHIAETLLQCSRETDTVARLGGDEFAIILTSHNQPIDTQNLAERIINQVSKALELDGHQVQVGISIGISIFPELASDVESLQKQADDALYFAKENGKNTFHVFKPKQ